MQTCPSCARHLLRNADGCPFCGASLATELPGGLGRAGKVALTAASVLTPAFLTACYGSPDKGPTDDTGGSSDDSGTEGDATRELTARFSADWTDAGVRVAIENGAGTYTFGLVEGGASADPWTGDDCMNGYTTTSGEQILTCHPMGPTGAFLWGGGKPGAIDPASQTVLTGDKAPNLTYMIQSDLTGQCWAWGANPRYYADLGCTPL